MKTIVTHIGPDLDAITSVWLAKTFLPKWQEASIAFVPAGTTLENMDPDSNPDIMHVDTGFGKFDHHQTSDDICASTLVLAEIKRTHGEDPPLERLATEVNTIDHFRDVYLPNPTSDRSEFHLSAIIEGWRLLYPDDPLKYVALGMECLDSIYKALQNKVWAENEIREKGREFESKWGKSLAVSTPNDDVISLAQKMGFRLVLRKDPKKQYVRIKSLPDPAINLTPIYETLKTRDSEATWFLHASHNMILNGSTKNPKMRPSTLSLEEIIDIIKSSP